MRRYIRSLIIAVAMTIVLAGGAAASHGEIHSGTFCDCVGLHMSQNAPGGGVGETASGASGGEISEAVRTCDVDGGVDFLD
jgi:hypothetical protein